MHTYLDFERPIAEVEGKIVELRKLAEEDPALQIDSEVARLQTRADTLVKDAYAKLTPWQKVQVARHPGRPHFTDYAKNLFDEFTPLAGDRSFGDDHAIITALARFRGRSVMVMGHEKGNDTKTRLKHNFGMAMPEGYRKSERMFEMADRFGLPVISLVDTSGAYNGVAAEERGQSEAIARSTQAGLQVRVPFITVVIGEGGSGGALAIATGNRVYMLEHAVYSVISPEGCASILWRKSDKQQEAAAAMRISAQDCLSLKVIDAIIPEPVGGAHRAPEEAILNVGEQIARALSELDKVPGDQLRKDRREKYLAMGRNLAI
ncbi:MAG: acetyl-CoA carboxylase carboxyltransferase subunit alpha [Proteobacteria bacterium]|nr:acetyl-CoA carboxylase carboxyltransferase subunit alpha [Pseudomonadota bacterium]